MSRRDRIGGAGTFGVEDTNGLALDVVEQFATYEDYLDSQVTDTDMFFLEDEELARQLVELGYRGSGDTLKREEFETRKQALVERSSQVSSTPKQLTSQNKNLSAYPFLQALANREELARNGKLTTVIFIRDKNSKGQEVSGYIDYAHRLKTESLEPYFERRKRLMPKPNDLSYFNWETQTSTSNSSPNFQVIAESESGLLFKNKRDRKIINVDPSLVTPGDNTTRTEIETHEYQQVVIYDHMTRRKT